MNSIEYYQRIMNQVTNEGLTDKTSYHAYEYFYPKLFSDLGLGSKRNILEIGTGVGGGLKILSMSFPNDYIYGLDHDYSILAIDPRELNIALLPQMKQTNRKLKKYLPKNLNLVIEDASHQYKDSMKTFSIIEPFLVTGGRYVIEDVYPEFLPNYQKDSRFEIVDLRKYKNRGDDILAIYTK